MDLATGEMQPMKLIGTWITAIGMRIGFIMPKPTSEFGRSNSPPNGPLTENIIVNAACFTEGFIASDTDGKDDTAIPNRDVRGCVYLQGNRVSTAGTYPLQVLTSEYGNAPIFIQCLFCRAQQKAHMHNLVRGCSPGWHY